MADLSPISGLIGVVLGAGITGACAYLVARATAHAQERTVVLRAQADFQLQAERLADAAVSSELALRRIKLEELHVFLSEVRAQCSQTQAQLDHQMSCTLEDHTARWTALLARLNQATAIVTIYFPNLSESMSNIAGNIDCFNWEHRAFLQTGHESQTDNERWRRRYQEIIKTSDETATAVWNIKKSILKEAEYLTKVK